MGQQPDTDQPWVEIGLEDCWDLLEAGEVGRLGYRLVDELHIVPINYAVDGRVLLFRTAAGNKLLAAEMHAEVAFEIDSVGEHDGWSVLARGRLRRLGEDELHRLAHARFRSWLPTAKYDVVELVPESVSGRRFFLHRPEVDDVL